MKCTSFVYWRLPSTRLGRKIFFYAKKEKEVAEEITVGNCAIKRSESTKLLGINIDSKQKWDTHFNGEGGLIKGLNKRTFTIRRISNQLPKSKLINLVHSRWMSKLRYGLELCYKVRTTSEEPENVNMKAVQVAQNKIMRMLDRVSMKEPISSKSLREKYDIPSVNQLSAEIKLTES